MNVGLFGFDGLTSRVGIWRSAFVPLANHVALRKYTVAHPFQNRPALVMACLRCRIPELGYLARQETLHMVTDTTSTGTGLQIWTDPDSVTYMFSTVGFALKNKSSSNSFPITNANWDVAMTVLG
jgi:hypothetical protein